MVAPVDMLAEHQDVILLAGTYVATRFADSMLDRFFGRRFFSPIYGKLVKKAKAIQTRHNNISSEFQFSIYLRDGVTVGEAISRFDDLNSVILRESNDLSTRSDVKWAKSKTECEIEYEFKDNANYYRVNWNLVSDSSALQHGDVNNPKDAPLSSIGVTIHFQFAFRDLNSEIIDLVAISRFIQKGVESIFEVDSVTNGKFIVSPLDGDLTMDDWVHDEQFDVSLLLKSDDSQRSVKFHGDRAEIISPTTEIDNETVDYIRATLLNYYL